MSGHSKWKTIQHKKGAADAKRGKIFSKIARELMIATRAGGDNPDSNATLRNILLKARSFNMPNENIDRAIKKGSGKLEGPPPQEIVYEAFVGGGVAMIVQVLTDNKNRAAAEIRHIFTKNGSDFASQGSVLRGFKRRGQIYVDGSAVAEDKLMGIVLDAGADDMSNDGSQYEILTDPGAFSQVMKALEDNGIKAASAEIAMVPDTYVPVNDKHTAASIVKFVSELEDHDDVQNVYTNMDVSEEVLAAMEQDKG